ncbi:MAG: hypothetical protein IID42_03180 [Planctomycetes bacterium]|nr:hypothetical protein [Planctomycetota bacterium]
MSGLDELKLARVVDACDGIDGRVKMQKIVYLLKVMGYDLPYDDFRIRQQGPFSRAVACDTDTLRGAEILIEEHGELGEGVVQYSYTVRDDVVLFVQEHVEVTAPLNAPSLEEICQELKGKGRAVLEVAATKVFLEREAELQSEELDTELERLKGHLSDRFEEANMLLHDFSDRGLL